MATFWYLKSPIAQAIPSSTRNSKRRPTLQHIPKILSLERCIGKAKSSILTTLRLNRESVWEFSNPSRQNHQRNNQHSSWTYGISSWRKNTSHETTRDRPMKTQDKEACSNDLMRKNSNKQTWKWAQLTEKHNGQLFKGIWEQTILKVISY